MSNAIQVKVEELNALNPTQIVENEKVEKKFIQMYNAIWDSEQGEQIYNREKFNFNKLLVDNPSLQECSKLSLFGCFLDMAVNGLSLDQSGRPQCYLIPRSVKVKTSTGEVWEKRAGLTVSAYGEVYMRQRAGQVRYVDNPVVVYEGDKFRPIINTNGAKSIEYEGAFPRKSDKPIAVFIRIVRNDGSVDYSWMMESDWVRLSTFSAKQNKGTANALYTSNRGNIDTGFLENKMIKHAFDAYPKVRTGQFTVMETQLEEPVIDYGIVDNPDDISGQTEAFEDADVVQPEQNVTIPPTDDDEGF